MNTLAEDENDFQKAVQQFAVTIGEGEETDLGYVALELDGENTIWSKRVVVNEGCSAYLS